MTDDSMRDFEKVNLAHWDEVTGYHLRDTSNYRWDVFRAGGSVLDPLVSGEIGDVAGLRLLHLQCHIGLDTLSLARLGAEVVGIDFSSEAIAAATALSEESGVPGRFVRCRVQDVPDVVDGPFDFVFTSWGAIIWLDDLNRWAEVIDWALKPCGTFYMAETHPLAQAVLEDPGDAANPIIVGHPMLSTKDPLEWHTDHDYVDQHVRVENGKIFDWNHDLGTVVTSLVSKGLRIEFLREHPFVPWRTSTALVEMDDYFYHYPPPLPPVPLSFSLRATKP